MEKIVNRVKENFDKNKYFLLIFVIIWAVFVSITLFHYKDTLGRESEGADNAFEVIELNEGVNVSQRIEIPENARTISLKYATYIRKNKGDVFVKVTGDGSGTVYVDEKTHINNIQDNAYITYALSEDVKDKTVTVELSSNSLEGQGAGVYLLTEDYFGSSVYEVNGEKQEYQLCVRYQVDNDAYSAFSTTVIALFTAAFSVLIIVYLLFGLKLETVVTVLVIIFGLILTVIMSPGANPDEGLHYESTLQLTNKLLGEDIETIDAAYVDYDSWGDHTNVSYSYNRLLRDFNESFELSGESFEFQSTIEGRYVGYYYPQALGLLIVRVCGGNMLKMFYAGRVTNLIFYAACVYLALRNAKSHKLLLSVIATLPIFVQQAASYSYDASVNALVLISVSFLFKWIKQEEKISKLDYGIVFVTCMLLAPAKIVYGLLTLLYFFVPYEKFGSKKKKYIMTGILCLPSIGLIIYNILIRTVDQIKNLHFSSLGDNNTLSLNNGGIFFEGDDGEVPLAKYYNVSYMIEHPVETVMIYVRTIRMWISTWFYQALGRGLAGVTLILPMTLIRAIIVLIIAAVLQADNISMSWKMRGATFVICVVIALLVLTTMLTGWTRRDDIYIQGMQGRYFCPLLPYFFAMFSNKKLKIGYDLEKPTVFAIICIMFFIMVYVLAYTFVN